MAGYAEIIGLLLGVVGAISSVWYLVERLAPVRHISWRSAQRASARVSKAMQEDGYLPSVIFGIGRGGAIWGSFISGCLGHRPLIVVDRKYTWVDGRRIEDLVLRLRLPPVMLDKVLLSAGEAHTGNTMRLYHDYFRQMGAKEIRRTVLVCQDGCTEPVEYVGVRRNKDCRLPWMFAPRYARESRGGVAPDARPSVVADVAAACKVCYVVRHGQSADNAAGDRYSGITDCPLTEEGIAQAVAVGKWMEDKQIERIYASPMKRAISTAREIQSLTGGAVVIDDRLREIDYGEWEGLTRKDVFARWPEKYEAYKADPVSHHAPGGEGPDAVLRRVLDFWTDLTYSLACENICRIVIVTHNAVTRMLLCHFTNTPLGLYREKKVDNSSISELRIDRNGNTTVAKECVVDHLKESAESTASADARPNAGKP